jgi:hypothetical protein
MITRTELSASERRFRSRIAQLATGDWFLRGTLNSRRLTCGKPKCRCAQGSLHECLYLVQKQQGKVRQIFVPKAWQKRVRQAVSSYQQMQQFIEEVSELEWKRLRERRPHDPTPPDRLRGKDL